MRAGSSGGARGGAIASPAPVPEAGPDRAGEVAGGDRGSRRRRRRAGSCGSDRAAGPNTGRAPSSTSKVDWWHGHSSRPRSGLVEPDRAADVGAQLRVGDDAVDASSPPGPAGLVDVRLGRVRMSRVGASAASRWPSGNTVTNAVDVEVVGPHRRARRSVDHPDRPPSAYGVCLQAPARAGARASGSGTAAASPSAAKAPRGQLASRLRRREGLARPPRSRRRRRRSPPRSDASRPALLGDLLVRHEALGPQRRCRRRCRRGSSAQQDALELGLAALPVDDGQRRWRRAWPTTNDAAAAARRPRAA